MIEKVQRNFHVTTILTNKLDVRERGVDKVGIEIRSLRLGDKASEDCEYWTGEVVVGGVPSCRG